MSDCDNDVDMLPQIEETKSRYSDEKRSDNKETTEKGVKISSSGRSGVYEEGENKPRSSMYKQFPNDDADLDHIVTIKSFSGPSNVHNLQNAGNIPQIQHVSVIGDVALLHDKIDKLTDAFEALRTENQSLRELLLLQQKFHKSSGL